MCLCVCVAGRFVNLGFDHYHTDRPEQELIRMQVFTNKIGKTCMYTKILHQYYAFLSNMSVIRWLIIILLFSLSVKTRQ